MKIKNIQKTHFYIYILRLYLYIYNYFFLNHYSHVLNKVVNLELEYTVDHINEKYEHKLKSINVSYTLVLPYVLIIVKRITFYV